MRNGLLLSILIAAFVFTACLGDQRTATSTVGATSPTPDGGKSPNGSDEAQLRELLTNFKEGTFTATYEADASSLGDPGGTGGPQTTLGLKVTQRGPERSRTIITLTADQFRDSLTMVTTPETTAVCTGDELGPLSLVIPIGEKKCIDASFAVANQDELVSLNVFNSIKSRNFKVLEVTHATVASEPAALLSPDSAQAAVHASPVGPALHGEESPTPPGPG